MNLDKLDRNAKQVMSRYSSAQRMKILQETNDVLLDPVKFEQLRAGISRDAGREISAETLNAMMLSVGLAGVTLP